MPVNNVDQLAQSSIADLIGRQAIQLATASAQLRAAQARIAQLEAMIPTDAPKDAASGNA